ncbi:MAG: hypothetical protein IJS88_02165 [Alphaproteobacteria bacterium]|nr:hypothetical protein [Alphaproteobacteria bacterium]
MSDNSKKIKELRAKKSQQAMGIGDVASLSTQYENETRKAEGKPELTPSEQRKQTAKNMNAMFGFNNENANDDY